MQSIKSYTDIEQSKKLAEILPIESADMCWQYQKDRWVGEPDYNEFPQFEHATDKRDIPCWSLAALLEQITKHGILDLRFLSSTFDNKGTHLTNVWNLIFEDIGNVSLDIYADNPVDACYEMIIRLNELNLL